MSLDVYLYGNPEMVKCECETCGHVHEHEQTDLKFEYNITHNLGEMAEASGLYGYLWRPDEHNISLAFDLITPLKKGLKLLQDQPDKYKAFNPTNKWGDYDGLCTFVQKYLDACEQNPDATIEVSR